MQKRVCIAKDILLHVQVRNGKGRGGGEMSVHNLQQGHK